MLSVIYLSIFKSLAVKNYSSEVERKFNVSRIYGWNSKNEE